MDTFFILISWGLLSFLVAGIAMLKNRSAAVWFFSAIVFSPLITFVVLIFLPGTEKYNYSGDSSINNESYKIYLTKQYNIEKIETIGKFQSQDKTFENAIDALRYAQSIDRGIALEHLSGMDPLLTHTNEDSHAENNPLEINPTKIKKTESSNQNSVIVTKSNGGSNILIAFVGIICVIGILYFSNQINGTPITLSSSLESREDVSNYKINGELAKAFNLNSKYTDIQRENLLKEIKGKLVIWEVEIYEIKKQSDKIYKIQTAGGLNFSNQAVSLFIELTAKDDLQASFIERLKTGEVIRVKGIFTGESVLRTLIMKPALLWYPELNTSQPVGQNNDSFIKELSKKGEVYNINPNLVMLTEMSVYYHIPGKQPGPYQCNISSKIYRIFDQKEFSYADIFGKTDPVQLINSIKNEYNFEINEESLPHSIENISFKTFNKDTFTLIDNINSADNCNSDFGPFRTSIIQKFFTESFNHALSENSNSISDPNKKASIKTNIIYNEQLRKSKHPRCNGSYEIDKCEAIEDKLIKESQNEKLKRQQYLDKEREKNMKEVNDS